MRSSEVLRFSNIYRHQRPSDSTWCQQCSKQIMTQNTRQIINQGPVIKQQTQNSLSLCYADWTWRHGDIFCSYILSWKHKSKEQGTNQHGWTQNIKYLTKQHSDRPSVKYSPVSCVQNPWRRQPSVWRRSRSHNISPGHPSPLRAEYLICTDT